MEAAVAVEVPAVEVRERLVGFVEEVASAAAASCGSGRTRFCTCAG